MVTWGLCPDIAAFLAFFYFSNNMETSAIITKVFLGYCHLPPPNFIYFSNNKTTSAIITRVLLDTDTSTNYSFFYFSNKETSAIFWILPPSLLILATTWQQAILLLEFFWILAHSITYFLVKQQHGNKRDYH